MNRYENPGLWNWNDKKYQRELDRIKEILSLLPDDVETILDTGCGNGIFVNNLDKVKYKRIVGLDISKTALEHLKTEKMLGNIADLPFPGKSFDLVCSFEVLEHLPADIYEKAILEIQRVSRKYIMISVPNEENLLAAFIKCPYCFSMFHANFHLRTFSKDTLETLFPEFTAITIKQIGHWVKNKNNIFCHLKKVLRLLNDDYKFPVDSLQCPVCGMLVNKYQKAKRKHLSLIFEIIEKGLRFSKKQRWLFALYIRRDIK
ncbi:MAG: class I SAM-dependent methyltransferase [Candidatus Omnitrophica bacterium]|nr:class I SAM-dependent methyltransferase [Candidatus Omnitrophota bacterium]